MFDITIIRSLIFAFVFVVAFLASTLALASTKSFSNDESGQLDLREKLYEGSESESKDSDSIKSFENKTFSGKDAQQALMSFCK